MKKKRKRTKIRILQLPVLLLFLALAIICDNANPSRTDTLADDTKIERFTHNVSNNLQAAKVASVASSRTEVSNIENETRPDNDKGKNTTKPEQNKTKETQVKEDSKETKDATSESNLEEETMPTPLPTSTIEITPTLEPTLTDTKYSSCISTGGSIKEFGNSCADGCAIAADPSLQCLMVITESCDCGDNMCWNGSECTDNPTPTPVSPEEVPFDPITPICGNGICEIGEKNSANCMVCDEKTGTCSGQKCSEEFLCPADCK